MSHGQQIDNSINAHVSSLDTECDYSLYEVVTDRDFSLLLDMDKDKLIKALKSNFKTFDNVTHGNLKTYIEFDFLAGDYCQMPYQFNSDMLETLDSQIKEYCEYMIGEINE